MPRKGDQCLSMPSPEPQAYRDLPPEEYADVLQRAGHDEETARFIAAVDASIARGELETSSADLANLLGRDATGPVEAVRAAHAG
ncbi:MAG TPA: hypothetical protein VFI65_14385 [Streptosporangiaceae bacterium]|nr:hypothetical protein [Streptosporangiaceae bacterium]